MIADAPVKGRHQLEGDKGPDGSGEPVEKHGVLNSGFVGTNPLIDGDPRRPEPRGTSPSLRIGILHAQHHPADPGRDQGLGTGGLLSLMSTGLQGNDDGRTERRAACGGEGRRFGVEAAVLRVPPLPDDSASLQHHRADHRVGRDPTPTPPGQSECPIHGLNVVHGVESRARSRNEKIGAGLGGWG